MYSGIGGYTPSFKNRDHPVGLDMNWFTLRCLLEQTSERENHLMIQRRHGTRLTLFSQLDTATYQSVVMLSKTIIDQRWIEQ